ncbi:MAG: synthase [Candidatus Hydrogenedentota bacterium]
MVTVNFTIIVETGLFLLFTGLMYAYVLRPLMRTMDERELRMREDGEAAQALKAKAEAAQDDYLRSLADAHREAAQLFTDGKRQAKLKHDEEIAALKAEGAVQLAALLKDLRAQARQQREVSGEVVRDIKVALAEKFGVKNGGAA